MGKIKSLKINGALSNPISSKWWSLEQVHLDLVETAASQILRGSHHKMVDTLHFTTGK